MPPPRPGRQARTSYALGLGANRARPTQAIAAALDLLQADGVTILAVSPIAWTDPVGPGTRRFANAAALVLTDNPPPAMLDLVKRIERALGRRSGRRWGDRPIDIDLLWWCGGRWRSSLLTLPHPALPHRRFVLDPLVRIAPGLRISGKRTVRQLRARLTTRRPVPRSGGAGSP